MTRILITDNLDMFKDEENIIRIDDPYSINEQLLDIINRTPISNEDIGVIINIDYIDHIDNDIKEKMVSNDNINIVIDNRTIREYMVKVDTYRDFIKENAKRRKWIMVLIVINIVAIVSCFFSIFSVSSQSSIFLPLFNGLLNIALLRINHNTYDKNIDIENDWKNEILRLQIMYLDTHDSILNMKGNKYEIK